ncbi:MAG: DUF393 domain-containing protein [Ignavibacteriales bacterium]|nr:DUF393 domain-containing protein [Ignavibacteriales bacterium]MCF8314740.1 DUF393 domain-containing protein [Ignavibacteriales bacterium]MCF8438012.1 DUF393 domain-containing protein [Ignavibacteriales bacterium]
MDDHKNSPEILVYDSECGICNNGISFLKKRVAEDDLIFIPALSIKSKIFNGIHSDEFLRSVYLIGKEKSLSESTAILAILKKMGFPYNLFYIFRFIPEKIRDRFYHFIAKRRYLFNKFVKISDSQR